MATALLASFSSLPIVQNFWHCFSCGQTRPQTAGSNDVSLMTDNAPTKSPAAAFARKPGISMATGQPCMQGLFAQFMQRDASSIAASFGKPNATSFILCERTFGSCSGMICGGIAIFSFAVISQIPLYRLQTCSRAFASIGLKAPMRCIIKSQST